MAPGNLRTRDAIVFVPGIMGSELVDEKGDVVWGMRPRLLFSEVLFASVLKRLTLAEDDAEDGIRASRLLGWPVQLPLLGGLEPYGRMVARLRETVEDPAALLLFPYDWRRSVAVNAERLRTAAGEHLDRWRLLRRDPSRKLTFVCHSMGGLLARLAAPQLDTREVITLGTPYRGAVKALRLLATGENLPRGLLADRLRDACRSLPGVYELLPHYQCVIEDRRLRALEPQDLARVGASEARAQAAFAVLERIAGAPAVPVRPLVGLSQPTFQAARFESGQALFVQQLNGYNESGDGTVFRRSAAPDGTQPSYLPQTHGAIAKSAEALTFVEAVLTESALGALQAHPKGIGLQLPEVVSVGERLTIVITGAAGVPNVRIENADTNALVDRPRVVARDDRLIATSVVRDAGLFRVLAAGGGLSPVQELVLSLAR